jgi:hypothetical protein
MIDRARHVDDCDSIRCLNCGYRSWREDEVAMPLPPIQYTHKTPLLMDPESVRKREWMREYKKEHRERVAEYEKARASRRAREKKEARHADSTAPAA